MLRMMLQHAVWLVTRVDQLLTNTAMQVTALIPIRSHFYHFWMWSLISHSMQCSCGRGWKAWNIFHPKGRGSSLINDKWFVWVSGWYPIVASVTEHYSPCGYYWSHCLLQSVLHKIDNLHVLCMPSIIVNWKWLIWYAIINLETWTFNILEFLCSFSTLKIHLEPNEHIEIN